MKTPQYWWVTRLQEIEGFGMVKSFGIACETCGLYDISTVRPQVMALLKTINRGKLSVAHFNDVVYDFLCTL